MHLDTHVVVWLYDSGAEALPEAARRLLEEDPLAVSPMVELELGLLHEIGRIAPTPPTILTGLQRALGVEIASTPFIEVVGAAAGLTWTRDPFDRLICAQAVAEQQLLLTKDRTIRRHLPLARRDRAGGISRRRRPPTTAPRRCGAGRRRRRRPSRRTAPAGG